MADPETEQEHGTATLERRGGAVALAVALAASVLIHGWAFRLDWPLAVGNWVHPDNLSNHWLLVWVAERVMSGESLLHNDTYYWPVGDAPLEALRSARGGDAQVDQDL